MANKKTGSGKTVKLTPVPPPLAKKVKANSSAQTTIVGSAVKVEASGVLKKPDLLDRAVERADVKRKDAKAAIEAALVVLAEALEAGDDINIPPLGKIKVIKTKDLSAGAKALTLKLRTPKILTEEEKAAKKAANQARKAAETT
mgnify:CR=1 FL=1